MFSKKDLEDLSRYATQTDNKSLALFTINTLIDQLSRERPDAIRKILSYIEEEKENENIKLVEFREFKAWKPSK